MICVCRYCGHGMGQKYLATDTIQQMVGRAVAVLMGCSSGQLISRGHLEATGQMMAYFLAGW